MAIGQGSVEGLHEDLHAHVGHLPVHGDDRKGGPGILQGLFEGVGRVASGQHDELDGRTVEETEEVGHGHERGFESGARNNERGSGAVRGDMNDPWRVSPEVFSECGRAVDVERRERGRSPVEAIGEGTGDSVPFGCEVEGAVMSRGGSTEQHVEFGPIRVECVGVVRVERSSKEAETGEGGFGVDPDGGPDRDRIGMSVDEAARDIHDPGHHDAATPDAVIDAWRRECAIGG